MKRIATILLLVLGGSALSGCYVDNRRRCGRGHHWDGRYCVRNGPYR